MEKENGEKKAAETVNGGGDKKVEVVEHGEKKAEPVCFKKNGGEDAKLFDTTKSTSTDRGFIVKKTSPVFGGRKKVEPEVNDDATPDVETSANSACRAKDYLPAKTSLVSGLATAMIETQADEELDQHMDLKEAQPEDGEPKSEVYWNKGKFALQRGEKDRDTVELVWGDNKVLYSLPKDKLLEIMAQRECALEKGMRLPPVRPPVRPPPSSPAHRPRLLMRLPPVRPPIRPPPSSPVPRPPLPHPPVISNSQNNKDPTRNEDFKDDNGGGEEKEKPEEEQKQDWKKDDNGGDWSFTWQDFRPSLDDTMEILKVILENIKADEEKPEEKEKPEEEQKHKIPEPKTSADEVSEKLQLLQAEMMKMENVEAEERKREADLAQRLLEEQQNREAADYQELEDNRNKVKLQQAEIERDLAKYRERVAAQERKKTAQKEAAAAKERRKAEQKEAAAAKELEKKAQQQASKADGRKTPEPFDRAVPEDFGALYKV